MAWVKGIKEVRHVTVAMDGDLVGMKRGPVMTRTERVVLDLLPSTWSRVLAPAHELPSTTGAGPCGTMARTSFRCRLLWSVAHLIHPLQAYYAAYVPPMRFGAKATPRGRRCA